MRRSELGFEKLHYVVEEYVFSLILRTATSEDLKMMTTVKQKSLKSAKHILRANCPRENWGHSTYGNKMYILYSPAMAEAFPKWGGPKPMTRLSSPNNQGRK